MKAMAKAMAMAVPLFGAVAAGCEPDPCPKGRALGPEDTPCTCEGAVIDDVACGNITCTAYGLAATTTVDTGSCSSSSSTTP